ncbi:hypothetical protein ACKWRH_45315 (plasmid) [Bradyrhizobium sp. Pa8]|uniref:hypothetical protein n=1 Tax=Bradyrhizobium sp. Pa8 TaxID=3386552 RepID=UPI00403F47D0
MNRLKTGAAMPPLLNSRACAEEWPLPNTDLTNLDLFTGGFPHPRFITLREHKAPLFHPAIALTLEKILRWTSPKPTIAAPPLPMWRSANSDDAIFEQAFEFDVGRPINPHLAFGSHGCLGAQLARLVVLNALQDRVNGIDSPVTWSGCGAASIPVSGASAGIAIIDPPQCRGRRDQEPSLISMEDSNAVTEGAGLLSKPLRHPRGT